MWCGLSTEQSYGSPSHEGNIRTKFGSFCCEARDLLEDGQDSIWGITLLGFYLVGNRRIHHECEGGIEKSVPRITVWHLEACQWWQTVTARDGYILSHNHSKNNGIFFLLTTKYRILHWRLPENPEFAEMRHGDVILTLQLHRRSTCGQRAVVRFYLSHGLISATAYFQQCGILTNVNSDEHVQSPFELRNSKWCFVSSLRVIEYSSD